MNSLFWMLAAR